MISITGKLNIGDLHVLREHYKCRTLTDLMAKFETGDQDVDGMLDIVANMLVQLRKRTDPNYMIEDAVEEINTLAIDEVASLVQLLISGRVADPTEDA